MPLKLIHGPPNSGKRGLILSELAAVLGRDPVLVVPNVDDVFDFERELCRERATLGATVTTFGGLIAALARATGASPPPSLTRAQRLRAASVAVAESRERLVPLRRSAGRPGFAGSLVRLLDELQGAGIGPDKVAAGAATLDGSAYLTDLATLFGAYERVRDRLGRGDAHLAARAAVESLRAAPGAWSRPVFLYGLDDLTGNQFELLRSLVAATEVTIALPYEQREVMAARSRLLERLREGIEVAEEVVTPPDPENTDDPLLFHLERSFGVAGAEAAPPTDSLTLLRSAGVRGEAEAVAAEVGRLLHAGAEDGQIAIVLADPGRRGPLLARVLESYGIATALETELPIGSSGVGGALLALLEAEHGTRRAADLLRWLRGPAGVRQETVDWLERAIRRRRARTAAEALDLWLERREELPGDLEMLRDAGPTRLVAAVAAIATRMAARVPAGEGGDGPPPAPGDGTELRAAARIATALGELDELRGLAPGPAELIEFLRDLSFRVWSGPVEGRVRIADPQRLRALRFDHVVIASLQDGEFPRRGGGDPFLSEALRESLGLEPRRDEEAEERYRFYTSLSLARRSLVLSYRESDESGAAEARSPLIDDVRELLDPPPPAEGPDPVEAAIGGGRGIAEVVYPVAEAPSRDELARSLAAAGGARPELFDRAGIGPTDGGRIAARLDVAAAAEAASRGPGPLRNPAVLERLGAVRAYGGTTLEQFDKCSYIWFAQHELRPQPLEPVPEPLLQGGIVHQALDHLYRERPGGEARPTPATLEAWTGRASELVTALASEYELGESAAERSIRRGAERLLRRFLAEEADRDAPFEPRLFEARFGEEEGADRPALELGGWLLHGAVDRVDEAAGGRALVHDYKVASRVTPAAKFEEEGKLQLPLYALAARELWGLDPVGALYHPLRATRERRPRGLLLEEERAELGAYGPVGTDVLSAERFEAAIAEARHRADRIVARMRSGEITRDPGPPPGYRDHDVCPAYCDLAPICRRDRTPVADLEREPEEP